MSVKDDPEKEILSSYEINAAPWTELIQNNLLPSRREVTNSAILSEIARWQPGQVLDVGCGEGWLVRAVLAQGAKKAVGIDGSSGLIAEARASGPGDFHVIEYSGLVSSQSTLGCFDLVVCNFSLIGEESVAALLEVLPSFLTPEGVVLIQTIHPLYGITHPPYKSGWREGTWEGFGDKFTKPHPWYYRTFASWIELSRAASFEVVKITEPLAPDGKGPSSLILALRPRGHKFSLAQKG